MSAHPDVEQVEPGATGTPEQVNAATVRMMDGVRVVMEAMGELSAMGVEPTQVLRDSIRGQISDADWEQAPPMLRMMFG